MPRRYQYDITVAPISTSKESVHVDAWMQPPTPPFRNWLQRAAAVAVVLAATSGFAPIDTKAITQPETVRVEKFKPDYIDIVPRLPLRSVALLAQSVTDSKLLTQKESVHLESWMQPPQYPNSFYGEYGQGRTGFNHYYSALQASGMAPIDAKVLTLRGTAYFDAWYQPPSIPLREPYPAATYFQNAQRGTAPVTDVTSIDKWFEPASIPKRVPYPFELYYLTGNQRNFASINHPENETWHAEYPNRLPKPYPEATYVASGSVGPVAPVVISETVTIDKWFEPASVPVRVLSRVANSQTVLTYFEFVSVDKWGQPTSQPVRIQPRLQGYVAVDAKSITQAELVSVDRWAQPTSQPSRTLPKPPSSQLVGDTKPLTPQGEIVTIDKWFHQQPDPLRPPVPFELYAVPGHLQAFSQSHGAYTVFYAQYPNFLTQKYPFAVYVASGEVVPVLVPTPEAILITKWFQSTSQPTRIKFSEATYVASGSTSSQAVARRVYFVAWIADDVS